MIIVNDEKLEDACWFMEYQDGDKEWIFEPELALAELLATERIFLNNHWWEEDWNEKQKDLISMNVNCNDVFAWACADAEECGFNELSTLWAYYKKDPIWGSAVWCMVKRKELPQKPVYDDIQKAGIWDLSKMKCLQKNVTDDYIHSLLGIKK